MRKTIKYSFLLVLTAFIWGVAFVAQSAGGDAVGPYTFNCIRSFIGAAVLLPVIRFREKKYGKSENKKTLIIGGVICGAVLCIASNLQQLGITVGDSVGKAGFLTACYIIFVPIIGIFIGKRCTLNVLIGTVLTVIGLYLLCVRGRFGLAWSDILLILSAVMFSIHILVIDRFGSSADPIKMSCIQFFVSGVITVFPMLFCDMRPDIGAWTEALRAWRSWIPILYAGIFSCGVAYTLQIVAQPKLNPTAASLILSLESVFSALAGWVILGQALSIKEISGCVLIFTAIVLAQIPYNKN
ncbi:MAG: DMT family transporter [Clostridia bacterium]|nr:DMT family transporter [Clostridia bacterium]